MENRESILNRPRKGYSGHNAENRDREYEKEQARLEAKRKKFNELNEHRRKALFGNYEDKKEVQGERKEEIDYHLGVRENQKKQEAVEDMIFSTTLKEQERAISSVEQDHARQKREYMKQLYEDNKRLEEYRAKTKKEQEEKEKYLARNQVEFFDRNKSYR